MTTPQVTRFDLTLAGDKLVANKLDDVTNPLRAIVVESVVLPADNFEGILTWCADNGWTIRVFLPIGARAWKGAARPVRNSLQIRRLRSELTAQNISGLNVHTLDLAYDC